MKNTAVNFMKRIDNAMNTSSEYYSVGDRVWIGKNINLVIRFFQETNTDRTDKSRPFRSQRTIGRFLREQTNAKDSSKSFKIMNAGITLMAHLFNDYSRVKYFKTLARTPFDAPRAAA